MKKKYHHQDLKNQIMYLATQKIDAMGEGAMSLRTIAKEIGVSPMAMYHHFQSKSDLLKCLAEQYRHELDTKITIDFAYKDTNRDKLIAMGKQYIAYAIEYPKRFRLMFTAENTLNPEKLMEQQPALFVTFAELVIRYFNLGNKNQKMVKIFSIWSSVHGLAVLASTGPLQSMVGKKGKLTAFIEFHLNAILG